MERAFILINALLLSPILMQVTECQAPTILKNPVSRLVPVNSVATFQCQAHCAEVCSVKWRINGSATSHQEQRDEFIQQGFSFPHSITLSHGVYQSTLTVNASILVNSTNVYCTAVIYGASRTLENRSSNATLLVTAAVSIKPNPIIIFQGISFLLKWSPPYLWPGHPIKYYNVTVSTLNIRNNTTASTIINATFNDLIVTHEEFLSDHDCLEYTFEVSAVTSSNELLRTFTKSGKYQRGPEEFGAPSLHTTTYFTSNLTPVIRTLVQPPPRICSYQEMNYTFIIRALNYSNESEFMEFGPFQHHGNSTMTHDIISEKLKANEEYSMQLVLVTYFDTVTFFNHTFGTYFQGFRINNSDTKSCTDGIADKLDYYKIATYVCGCFIILILLLLSTLVLFIVTHYNYWNTCRRTKTSTERAHDAMVHNPIYSGPVYESVRLELRTLSIERSSSTSSSNPCNSPSPNNNNSALQEKGNCYVDPPSRPQATPAVAVLTCNQQRSNSFVYSGQSHSASQSVSDENNTLRSQSDSVTTSGRKGKERNKFHLTLSLGQDGNDSTSKKDVVSCVNPISIREVDENYAIMSPAGTVGGLLMLSPEDTEKYKE